MPCIGLWAQWFGLTQTTNYATGQRSVRRDPTAGDDLRWSGRIDNERYRDRAWRAPDPETVIKHMDRDLGAVDPDPARAEAAYVIEE